MSMDALDRTGGGYHPLSKEKKREYAIKKKEEENQAVLNDPIQTKKGSQMFRDHVSAERKRLGLDKPQETTMYCNNCFRMNCVCE